MREALIHLAHSEAKMANIIASVSLSEPQSSGDVYYDLLNSIVSQQLSTQVAVVIFNRFLKLFPGEYPHPRQLLALETEELRAVGLSRGKAQYMQNVAEFWLAENLETKNWDEMDDDAIVDYLSQIKGVGRWTVEMILIFTLQRPDVFPVDDLGVQQAMMLAYGLEKDRNLRKRMIEIAESWRPYRSTASRALWRWKHQVKK
ncbi:DNA-3-methyladenine glycosylase 2 family protein [Siphonobacter sp. SORGH_AS_0500]|uniref:DNA-3-methyladenine glycosylase family protein n=1 Tax=Siphonobacter sp. SORGH_AS_0500 TaxID=1864824 RepID=UPI002865790D|nr:DNA-3-methyladenine glycosylase 2 family protein [Siphonobacter sp. SORGH_AS_0500]MDR6196627.1 DNA-3-methyladenine glycosylase II [Siphonobacter sp. SORGH_AS_0500]